MSLTKCILNKSKQNVYVVVLDSKYTNYTSVVFLKSFLTGYFCSDRSIGRATCLLCLSMRGSWNVGTEIIASLHRMSRHGILSFSIAEYGYKLWWGLERVYPPISPHLVCIKIATGHWWLICSFWSAVMVSIL